MEIKKLFGQRLKEIRISKGLTQEALSEKIGIQPENYSRIENGISFPKPENLVKISTVLEVELLELFQFNKLHNHDEILDAIICKLKTDEESTAIVYKFLRVLGKI